MNKYVVINGEQASTRLLTEALELNRIYKNYSYSNKKLNYYLDLLESRPNTFSFVIHNGNCVGYLNLVPLKEHQFRLVSEGQLNSSNMSICDLAELKESIDNLGYLSDFVIHEDYINTTVAYILLNALFDKIHRMSEQEIYFREFLVEVSTERSSRKCRLLGLEQILYTVNQNIIYHINFIYTNINSINHTSSLVREKYTQKFR